MWERNVKLKAPLKRLSSWRKTSLGAWKNANDASIYAQLEVDATPLLAKVAASAEHHVTLTSIIGKAAAKAVHEYPLINSIIRWGRIYPREEINIFFQVYYKDDMDDVLGVCVKNCDQLSLADIAAQLRKDYLSIRRNKDADSPTRGLYKKLIPGFLARPFWSIVSFILYTLNIKILLKQADFFGSAMITTLSTFDIDSAFAPLIPFTRCPVIISVGKVQNKPVVNDKHEIVVKPMLSLGLTLDHRLVDGAGAGRLLKGFKAYLANPT